MKKPRRKTGFTLLELMVSVAILGLVAVMLSRIFSQSTKAVEQGQNQVLLDESARLILDLIETDLSQALIRTNVSFTVSSSGANDRLYFISTGMRRHTEKVRRDFAPMRFQLLVSAKTNALQNADWNQYFNIETYAGAHDEVEDDMIRSDYYFNNASETAGEFSPIHFTSTLNTTYDKEYSEAQETGVEQLALITFLKITVNADTGWNSTAQGTPDINNLPRFADVSIGLVSAEELNRADQTGNREIISDNERIYSRRIYLRNSGISALKL